MSESSTGAPLSSCSKKLHSLSKLLESSTCLVRAYCRRNSGKISAFLRWCRYPPSITSPRTSCHCCDQWAQRFIESRSRIYLDNLRSKDPSSDTFLLSSVIFELSNGAQEHPHLVTHLYPSGCPNLSSAISSIITGFISSGFRSSARSLASYDINVLEAWYNTQGTAYSNSLRVLLRWLRRYKT